MKRINNSKKCGRCKLEIREKDYCSVSDFHNRKRKKEVFLHLKCWRDFEERKRNVDEAMGMMRGLKGALTKMGIFSPEKVIIE